MVEFVGGLCPGFDDGRLFLQSGSKSMLLKGTVKNGVVVLDEGPVLPDGTPVQVAVHTQAPQDTLGKRMMKFAGTVANLPADMAQQHDY